MLHIYRFHFFCTISYKLLANTTFAKKMEIDLVSFRPACHVAAQTSWMKWQMMEGQSCQLTSRSRSGQTPAENSACVTWRCQRVEYHLRPAPSCWNTHIGFQPVHRISSSTTATPAASIYAANFLHTQGSHASWKVLDFFLENSRHLESPGKALWSWKVLEIEA